MIWLFALILMIAIKAPGWLYAVWSVCLHFIFIFHFTEGVVTMTNTREEIEKAIKHYKCERDGAIVVLDSGFGSKPGQSDLLYRNRKERAQLAIDALEKQLPQKPIGTYTDYKCPVCGRRVRSGKGSSSHGQRDNFCQRCGQKLDWEE